MNRIKELFEKKEANICNFFLTAGYPSLNDTISTVLELEANGVDMVEIGIPFSDPLADGETIQESSIQALDNGMTISILFNQVEEIRSKSTIPIVLMGYLNPIHNYGLEKFLSKCEEVGVDGLIIPDISLEEYEYKYQSIFDKFQVPLTFLITPKTSIERIRKVEKLTETFLYLVSSSSITGSAGSFSEEQLINFERIKGLQIDVPVLVGFGIHNSDTFKVVNNYFNGAIIGSAFIRAQKAGVGAKEFIGELEIG
jgi:tryptophan synthase alpha chain